MELKIVIEDTMKLKLGVNIIDVLVEWVKGFFLFDIILKQINIPYEFKEGDLVPFDQILRLFSFGVEILYFIFYLKFVM